VAALGTVVAAGLVAILLLQTFSVYMNTSLQVSALQMGTANDQASIASADINTRAQVDSVGIVNQTHVALSVENTGTVPIQATSLQQVDVILIYTTASNGTDRALWMPYSTTPSSPGWAVVSATTADGGPKVLNPMNCPYPTYGVWDPSDVLHIVVTLSPADAINATDTLAVLLATPAGTTSLGET